jgi:hypothetical protein
MKTGQPKLSVRKSQKSGFFVTPTKSDNRPALRGDDFRLKESITSGFTGRQEPFPADPVQPLVRWSFHQCFSNSEKGISFRNPFLP